MNAPRTICVVDDDVAILEVVRLVLEDEGYQVVANNGQDTLDFIHQTNPDLVLLDVWMQGVDGRDVSKAIKTSATHTPQVVLMSAHSDASKSVQQAQADGFLEKPFGMDELVKVVEEYIS